MKFINNQQFERYFYNYDNRKMQLDEATIPIHARDIFGALQQSHALNQPVLFLVGPGKNGRLALELARLCAFSQIRTHIFIAQTTPSKRDLVDFFKDKMTFVQVYNNINDPLLQALFDAKTLLIDGLFATGIQSSLDSHYENIINNINKSMHGEIYSLIIPSGMNNDSEIFIKADKVLTVGYVLETLLLANFPLHDIICIESQHQLIKYKPTSTIASHSFDNFRPTLNSLSHKYNRGMILSFGGLDYFGAGILALKAMQKINACMIQHFTLEKQQLTLLAQLPEIVFRNIRSSFVTSHTYNAHPSVAAFGFGVSETTLLEKHFRYLMHTDVFMPFVLDAGALPLVAQHAEGSRELHPIIITPHIGEFAQLLNLSIEEVLKNKLALAREYAKTNNVIVVLKSATTIVTNGTTTWINPLSIATLATPGSGDVLCGIIAGHIDHTTTTQNLFDRVCAAVYRHSHAAASLDASNITASMLIEAL